MNVLLNITLFYFLCSSLLCFASEPQDEIQQLKTEISYITKFVSSLESKLKEVEKKLDDEKEKTTKLANALDTNFKALQMLLILNKEQQVRNGDQQQNKEKRPRTKSKEEKKKKD